MLEISHHAAHCGLFHIVLRVRVCVRVCSLREVVGRLDKLAGDPLLVAAVPRGLHKVELRLGELPVEVPRALCRAHDVVPALHDDRGNVPDLVHLWGEGERRRGVGGWMGG